jgi:uncharacterized protein YgiM (DUF1202 family)
LAALACKATESAPPAPLLLETNESIREVITPPPEPERETCHVKTNITSGALNLRSCAGTACSVITYLTEGETLTILERGAWLKVETVTSKQGYVNSKFCEMENK